MRVTFFNIKNHKPYCPRSLFIYLYDSHDKEQIFMSATVMDFSLLWRRILFSALHSLND